MPTPRINPFEPVHPAYCADPFVLAAEGAFYAFGTGGGGQGQSADTGHFVLLRSTDLETWERLPAPLLPLDTPNVGTHFWAPEAARGDDGKYYLYYSVGKDGEAGHQLRVAISEAPGGPYRDVSGPPLIPQSEVPFAIDAHPFRDADGTWYLFYARDFLEAEPNGFRSGTGLAVDKLETMTRLARQEKVVLRARYDWQRFENNRQMAEYGNQVFDWHTLEGAFVVPHDGQYYCFFSGAAYHSHNYGVDYAVAPHPLGPWSDSDPSTPRVLKTIPNRLRGPGHNSVFTGPDGQQYLAYHAWNPENTHRQMYLARLIWTPDGPRADLG